MDIFDKQAMTELDIKLDKRLQDFVDLFRSENLTGPASVLMKEVDKQLIYTKNNLYYGESAYALVINTEVICTDILIKINAVEHIKELYIALKYNNKLLIRGKKALKNTDYLVHT